MITCAICKRPIRDEDLYIVVDGCHIHIDHPGVRETYIKKKSDIKIGFQMRLKPLPFARPKKK